MLQRDVSLQVFAGCIIRTVPVAKAGANSADRKRPNSTFSVPLPVSPLADVKSEEGTDANWLDSLRTSEKHLFRTSAQSMVDR